MPATDYNFYKDIFGGTAIPQKQFYKYERLAEHFINSQIVNSPNLSEDFDYKMAICHTAELLRKHELCSGISREDNDGYSVSYNGSEYTRIAAEIISIYLADKGALYCGIGG